MHILMTILQSRMYAGHHPAITQAMSAAQWHELMSLLIKVACNPLHLQGTDLCRTYLMPAG